MTPTEIKEARESLGLTQAQLGRLLDTDAQTVRRMEMAPEAKTFRKPAPRMVRLIEAYLAGYMPDDWPLESTAGRGPLHLALERYLIRAEGAARAAIDNGADASGLLRDKKKAAAAEFNARLAQHIDTIADRWHILRTRERAPADDFQTKTHIEVPK